MSFNPLISLARNAKRQRMEMQCDPQWVLDLAAERDQLRAERDNLFAERKQLESELRHRQKLIDDAWHAWEVALKGCEAMRAERDQIRAELAEYRADPSYSAACETIRKLRAELEAIRGQQPVGYQYQDRNGEWHGFCDELHYQNTVEDGTWPIRAIYALPHQQPDAVSVPRELLESLLRAEAESLHGQYEAAMEKLRALLTTKTDGVV